jgi:hypothetical protein
MPYSTSDSAEANAREACRDIPKGVAYEECIVWTTTEVTLEEQIAADRADLFVIIALSAPILLVVALIFKWRGSRR